MSRPPPAPPASRTARGRPAGRRRWPEARSRPPGRGRSPRRGSPRARPRHARQSRCRRALHAVREEEAETLKRIIRNANESGTVWSARKYAREQRLDPPDQFRRAAAEYSPGIFRQMLRRIAVVAEDVMIEEGSPGLPLVRRQVLHRDHRMIKRVERRQVRRLYVGPP